MKKRGIIIIGVVAIVALASCSTLSKSMEKSRDQESLANIRSAYAEAATAMLEAQDTENVSIVDARTLCVSNIKISSTMADDWSGCAEDSDIPMPEDPGKAGSYSLTISMNEDGSVSEMTLNSADSSADSAETEGKDQSDDAAQKEDGNAADEDDAEGKADSEDAADQKDTAVAEETAASEQGMAYEVTDTRTEVYSSLDQNYFYTLIEVTNTGSTNLYLDAKSFDLEDSEGHLLQTEDMISAAPDIIAPGEKGYFYNGYGLGGTQINEEVDVDAGFQVVPNLDIEEASGSPCDYEVSDTSLSEDTFGPAVTGRVTNTTDEDCSLLYINVLFYDLDGRILYASGTNITDLKAGDTQSFEYNSLSLPDEVTMDNIGSFEVVAREPYYQF